MDSFWAKLIFIFVVLGLIIGGGIWALLHYVFPAYYPDWYGAILLFFLIVEILIITYVYLQSRKKEKPQKMVNVYLLTKVVKMLLALTFVTVYVLAVKEQVKNFVLVFMIFYIVFLAIESRLFIQIEKHLKKKTTVE
jgi:hypothetical protein